MKCDKEGRYSILFGTLQNEKCTIVNIYTPNSAQASFLAPISTRLAKYVHHPILMGGDFNLVKDALIVLATHFKWTSHYQVPLTKC